MNGDSDDTDIRDLLTVAAYIFRDPVLKYVAWQTIDFESIWDLGVRAIAEYQRDRHAEARRNIEGNGVQRKLLSAL